MRQRKTLIVNWSVQGPILKRLCVHLATFVAALSTLLMIFWMVQNAALRSAPGVAEEPLHTFWYRAVPFASASLVLLPLIIWDMLRITNRMAGPLYRFEQVMKKFEETGELDHAELRENDLVSDFCDRFNSFVAVMHERYPECAPASREPSDSSCIKSFEEPAVLKEQAAAV